VTTKPLRLRAAAERDVRQVAFAYRAEAGEAVARQFADALARALRHIALDPATGSLRYAGLSGKPGVRFWPLRRFPLVFYIERPDHIDVVRVLHGKRDIPVLLAKRV
jgi:toxin ParE1/3/4